MTQSQMREHSDTSVVSQAEKQPAPRKSRAVAIGLQLLAMLGLAVLLYPKAADWITALGHDAEVSGYIREVESMPAAAQMDVRKEARDYNATIPGGVLRDPYTRQLGEDEFSSELRYQSYLEQLVVGEQETIGELSYPRLGMSLPIYHGTSDAVLSRGAGHLYGSSLPVGGPSSHSVMTSHSGLLNAELFTKLPDAQLGDVFTVTVLGETQYYEVRNVDTVLPHETGSLQVIEGEDWVTLLTCTPINVNSHRFLAQAQRIPAPPGKGVRTISSDGVTPGFPWWALVFSGGSAAAAFLIFASPKKHQAGRHRVDETQRVEQSSGPHRSPKQCAPEKET